MKTIKNIIIFSLILLIPACGKKTETNKVPLEQLNTDKSNNYKFIFKDVIEKDNKRKEQERKDPFKD